MATTSSSTPAIFSTDSPSATDRNLIVEGIPVAVIPCNARLGSLRPIHPQQLLRRHCDCQLRPKHRAFVYRSFAAALSFLIFLGLLLFTIWIFLRPRMPEVRVASAALSPLSTTSTNLTFACNATLLLTNPNHKLTVLYDSFQVLLYLSHEEPLANVQLPPFAQPRTNDTILQAHLEISNANVGYDTVKALRNGLARGALTFGVEIVTSLRIENKEWKMRGRLMRAFCDNVTFEFSSQFGPGILVNPYEECQGTL